ncbi:stearoyl-CoA desaturase (delta-9 desaturase) [Cryptococcus deuterogattii R265]|uniref:stearoyl-CoA 9-desaturase n=1 Tax=Cryptococcus deuterogattii (strain R265) TaxID=294750 RepID=A0A095C3H0_CRYD2|nr:stearoyl-CoA desaturase (delta-9 desaturase) [Cryptococcus deuterogattii R265]KIR75431.1 stearoyl-CoA desaturase (delta-9 desaturase) [Cryptococcus deuterogattii CA1014]
MSAAVLPMTPPLEKEESELVHRRPSPADELTPPHTPEQNPCKSTNGKGIDPIDPALLPSDRHIPDNYVSYTIANQKYLPPITWKNLIHNIQWISFLALTVTPSLAIYGIFTTAWNTKTAIWSVIYYFITGLGITAGYHRLWAHRAYNASIPLQYVLATAGSGAVEGSIKWWCRGHRAHHRYTDTDLDPYSAEKGFFWSHVGWMLVKPRGKIGVADVSDLSKNRVVKWQHRNYIPLILGMGFVFPTVVAGLGWGDWRGGFFFAGAARLCFVHHSTFCVNSLAHWLGEQPFDNKHSPRDHIITALCTIGEGYHNFHHQFPQDFRNAIKWFQYDPTKWFIWTMSKLGLASHLKRFPDNEVKKGQYTMKLQLLKEQADELQWPKSSNDLPVISWDDFKAEAKERSLVAIHGFIHDCSSFVEDHPGGAHLIKRAIGTDATTAFFGGVYDHSNAAHNLLAMMRVGILDGGMEVEHLKRRPADSEASSITNSPVSSASASSVDIQSLADDDFRLDQTQLNSQGPKPKAPFGQPQAQVADRWTLSVPPSEKLRIIQTVPEIRPGLLTHRSVGKLDKVTKADVGGEANEFSGKAPVAAA